MRIPRFAAFPFVVVVTLTACAQGPATEATSPGGVTCDAAYGHLDACVAAYCDAHPGEALCEVLLAPGTLSGVSDHSCDGMAQGMLDHMAGASCEDLLAEARLHATGKADVPCPSYFPWCNELAPKGAGYRVNLLEFGAGAAQVEILLPDIARTAEVRDGQVFHKLHLPGAGALREVGRPAIPQVSFLLGLPPGTDRAWIESQSTVESFAVDGITLFPAQHRVQEDSPAPPFAFDAAFYGADAVIPADDGAVDPVGTWRNYRVARVTVHPLKYNPGQRHLDVATQLRLLVRFADEKDEVEDTVAAGEATFAGAYGAGLVNYPEAAATKDQPTDEPRRPRYLVIAHDPLADALKPLVELKESQGLTTELVKLSEVGADPEKIKARIAQSYQDNAIEYVLLVGDVADLPMYTYKADPDSWEATEIPSDYWYSLLAGDDLLAEVAVGRLSAKTPEELAIHVAKTVAYETGDPQAAWRQRVALLAHEEQYPKKYTECTESLRTRRFRPGVVDFTRLYGGEHVTTQRWLDVLNGGVGVVAYRGHGSETAWAEWNGEDFGGAHEGIKNGAMTPVVFSIACLNLALQHSAPTNAEQWVLRPEGGAVAFLGATQPSWTVPNHDFMRYLFEGMLDEGIVVVGPLVNRARAAMLAQYGGKDDAAENAKMYAWLGDPSLEVGRVWQMRAEVRIGWCNLQWPETLETQAGQETGPAYGQVWINGVTNNIGPGEGIEAALGYGPVGSLPDDTWSWTPATYNVDNGSNDEYVGKLTPADGGTYSYAFRFKGADDTLWLYCDLDGTQNGLGSMKLGTLNVQAPPPPPAPLDAGAGAGGTPAPPGDAGTPPTAPATPDAATPIPPQDAATPVPPQDAATD